MQIEIKRMHRLFDPGQRIRRERIEVGDRGVAVEGRVAVDGETHPRSSTEALFRPGADPAEGCAADLDLEAAVALRDRAAHIIAEPLDIVAGR